MHVTPFLQKTGRAAGQHSGFSASRWWMWKIPVRGPNVVSLKPDDFYTSKVTQKLVEQETGHIPQCTLTHVLPTHQPLNLWCCFSCLLRFHTESTLACLLLCLPTVLLVWLFYPLKQVCIPACVHNLVNKGMSLCPAASFSGGFIHPYLWLLSLQLTQPSDPMKTFCPQAGGTLSPCWFELCPHPGLMNPSGLQTLNTRGFFTAGKQ